MANDATQDQQEAALASPLGKDVLLLTRFDCTEGMGELFVIRTEVLSPRQTINFDKALGQNCSIHLKTHDDVGRDFSGVLTEASWLGPRGDFYLYTLVLRPWFWLLSLTSDCRIFPNMTPKEIINQVFQDRGFNDVLDLTVNDYPKLEYTVQYQETDLNFVLRLMEKYGILLLLSIHAWRRRVAKHSLSGARRFHQPRITHQPVGSRLQSVDRRRTGRRAGIA